MPAIKNKDYEKDFSVKCDRCANETLVEHVLSLDENLLNQYLSEKGWVIKITKTIAGRHVKRICSKCGNVEALDNY